MTLTDDQVVARIREADTDALAEFFVRRRMQLLAFIERQLGPGLRSKIEPEDIFQEVSADAVRSLANVELGDRDPFSWLCQVAERRIIDAHRRYFGAQKRAAGREVSLNTPAANETNRVELIDLIVMTMTTASQAFSRDQKQIQLQHALQKMPEEQREALKMRYIEGLPSKQIAERMGKSDGAVRVMLSRALSRLQQMLGPEQSI